MTVCGVIAEFNPFHNGHAYLLKQARALTDADYLIVVMSGDYVQRGAPACMDKYCRTKIAISSGADAVWELPVYTATGSAEYFARGAVAALDALGIVDYLCFGSESGDLEELWQKASVSPGFRQSGRIKSVIEPPNNILAIEYLRALRYFRSPIKPVTVKRQYGFYESCSAFDLRKRIAENPSDDITHILSGLVPDHTLLEINSYYQLHRYLDFDDLSDLLFCHLLINREEDLTQYFDIYPDLADKIRNALYAARPASAFHLRELLKSRDITLGHISRALLHILLSIKDSDIELLKAYKYCAYLRLLGFCRESRPLMNAVKSSSGRPVITKLADAGNILSTEQLHLLHKETASSELYQQLSVRNKKTARIPGEYRQSIIITSHHSDS